MLQIRGIPDLQKSGIQVGPSLSRSEGLLRRKVRPRYIGGCGRVPFDRFDQLAVRVKNEIKGLLTFLHLSFIRRYDRHILSIRR